MFAKQLLPKDFCFPFGGIYRTCEEWDNIKKHVNTKTENHRTSHAAEVIDLTRSGKKKYGVADAHPSNLKSLQLPFNAWPGALCNQANQPIEQNGELFQHQGKCSSPKYSWIDKRCRNLFVKIIRPVAAGEEVFVNYNYSKHKQTRLGFGYEAKFPKIKSNYSFRKRNNDKKYGDTVIID